MALSTFGTFWTISATLNLVAIYVLMIPKVPQSSSQLYSSPIYILLSWESPIAYIHIKYFSAANNNPAKKWEIKYLYIPKFNGSWHGLSGSYLSRLSFQQVMWPFPDGHKRAATTSYSRQEGEGVVRLIGQDYVTWPQLAQAVLLLAVAPSQCLP